MAYTQEMAVEMSRVLLGLDLLTLPSVPQAKSVLSVEEGGETVTFRTYQVDDIRRVLAGGQQGSAVPVLPKGRLLKDLLSAYVAHCLEGLGKEWHQEELWSSASRWVLTEAINGGLGQIKGSGLKRCVRRLRKQFLSYLPAKAEILEAEIQASLSLINTGSLVCVEAPPAAVCRELAAVMGASSTWQWLYWLYYSLKYWLKGFKNLNGCLKQLEQHMINSVAQQRSQEAKRRNLLVPREEQLSPSQEAVALADRAMHLWVGQTSSGMDKAAEGELVLVASPEEQRKGQLREKLESLGLDQEALRKELVAFCDMAHEKRLLLLLPNFLLNLSEGEKTVERLSMENYRTFVKSRMGAQAGLDRESEMSVVQPVVWVSEEECQSVFDLAKAEWIQQDLDALHLFFEGLGLAIAQRWQKVKRSDLEEIGAGFKEIRTGFKEIGAGFKKVAADQEKTGAEQKKTGRLADFAEVQQWLLRVSKEVASAGVWPASAQQIGRDCAEFQKLADLVVPINRQIMAHPSKDELDGAVQESSEVMGLRERCDELLVRYRPVMERLLGWKAQCLKNGAAQPSQSSPLIALLDQPPASSSQTPVTVPGSVLFGSIDSRTGNSTHEDQHTPM